MKATPAPLLPAAPLITYTEGGVRLEFSSRSAWRAWRFGRLRREVRQAKGLPTDSLAYVASLRSGDTPARRELRRRVARKDRRQINESDI